MQIAPSGGGERPSLAVSVAQAVEEAGRVQEVVSMHRQPEPQLVPPEGLVPVGELPERPASAVRRVHAGGRVAPQEGELVGHHVDGGAPREIAFELEGPSEGEQRHSQAIEVGKRVRHRVGCRMPSGRQARDRPPEPGLDVDHLGRPLDREAHEAQGIEQSDEATVGSPCRLVRDRGAVVQVGGRVVAQRNRGAPPTEWIGASLPGARPSAHPYEAPLAPVFWTTFARRRAASKRCREVPCMITAPSVVRRSLA